MHSLVFFTVYDTKRMDTCTGKLNREEVDQMI
jgi:hypothetical protein